MSRIENRSLIRYACVDGGSKWAKDTILSNEMKTVGTPFEPGVPNALALFYKPKPRPSNGLDNSAQMTDLMWSVSAIRTLAGAINGVKHKIAGGSLTTVRGVIHRPRPTSSKRRTTGSSATVKPSTPRSKKVSPRKNEAKVTLRKKQKQCFPCDARRAPSMPRDLSLLCPAIDDLDYIDSWLRPPLPPRHQILSSPHTAQTKRNKPHPRGVLTSQPVKIEKQTKTKTATPHRAAILFLTTKN
jgi:hypothetical protein